VTLPFPTTSKNSGAGLAGRTLLLSMALMTITSCATTQEASTPTITTGSIAYPFIGETRSLGSTKRREPFVIRSATGSQEYTVEIPENSSRYDIQIPLAEITPAGSTTASDLSGRRAANPANTDKELVSALPDIAKEKSSKTGMLDSAFGVAPPEGPVQSPSYTLGIAKVNQHFKERNFELALVELNNLLAFYPNSPKLLKMKGTLLVKTGNRELAMRSWQRALDLAPNDLALRNSINRLNERIIAEQNAKAGDGLNRDKGAGFTPVGNDPESLLDKVSH
jgi:hypothetical protein